MRGHSGAATPGRGTRFQAGSEPARARLPGAEATGAARGPGQSNDPAPPAAVPTTQVPPRPAGRAPSPRDTAARDPPERARTADAPAPPARARPPAPWFSRRGGAEAPEFVPSTRERCARAELARSPGAASPAVRPAGNTIRPARSRARSAARHPLGCAWPRVSNGPKSVHGRSLSAVRCNPIPAATTKALSKTGERRL